MNDVFYQNWSNQTTLHPLAAIAIAVLGVAFLIVPRAYALWPMMIVACFISPAQRVVLFTLDFDLLRVMVLFGWARLLLRGECSSFQWNFADTMITAWGLLTMVALIAQGIRSVPNSISTVFDSLGMYFLFRCLITSWSEARMAITGFMWISIPVALAFLVESSTGRNMFATFGGVPAITESRNGRLRCQGAFAHSILAGCFWATLIPLMASQVFATGRSKLLAIVGCLASALIVVLCASSTPIASIMFGMIGCGFFVLWRNMRIVRWALLIGLISLHMMMTQPVWDLIARIDLAGGSTSWHRVNLINQTISHANEWFVFGSSLGSAHWSYGTADVTDLYIVQCLNGGISVLALFVAVIAVGFRDVGKMMHVWQSNRARQFLIWSLGVSLFIHVMNFIGVSYFGQINMIWYLLLAMISSLSLLSPATVAVAQPAKPSAVAPTVPRGSLAFQRRRQRLAAMAGRPGHRASPIQ